MFSVSENTHKNNNNHSPRERKRVLICVCLPVNRYYITCEPLLCEKVQNSQRFSPSCSLFHGKKHNSGTVWFILVVISRQEAQFGNGLVHPGRYFTARSTIRERSGSSWSLFHGKKHNSGTVWFILVVISQDPEFILGRSVERKKKEASSS